MPLTLSPEDGLLEIKAQFYWQISQEESSLESTDLNAILIVKLESEPVN